MDFWFDPVCPYTWLTSRWLAEVTKVRPVTVRWRVMSLQVLNEGLEVNPEDPDGEWGEYLWAPARLCAVVGERHGSDALGRYLAALGVRLHERGEWTALADALADAGLPAHLADAAWDERHDAAVRASHAEAVALVGEGVGTPVTALRDAGPYGRTAAFFGPVVSPAPAGEAAGRLWDGLTALAAVPGFCELKRTRTEEPDFTREV
ncbi:DsbA family protein [Streptomyces armeniacus]|uniref:DsbA family protein n=1 Tax=Streptomyces armeniacus TaxID=83291 RepID=UPI001AD84FA1|nr:DsbA family protein [Streptomyces armeniacus]